MCKRTVPPLQNVEVRQRARSGVI